MDEDIRVVVLETVADIRGNYIKKDHEQYLFLENNWSIIEGVYEHVWYDGHGWSLEPLQQ